MLGVAPAPNAPAPPRPGAEGPPGTSTARLPSDSEAPTRIASPGATLPIPLAEAPAHPRPVAVGGAVGPVEAPPPEGAIPRVTMPSGTSVPPPETRDATRDAPAAAIPWPVISDPLPAPDPAAPPPNYPTPPPPSPRDAALQDGHLGFWPRPWDGSDAPRAPMARGGVVGSLRAAEPSLPVGRFPSQAPTLVSADTGARSRRRRGWWLGGMIGAALLVLSVAGVALTLWILGRQAVRATVAVDPDGTEALLLDCARCVDGTAVRLGAASGTFTAHRASIALPDRLEVGENELGLSFTRPDGTSEDVKLVVPVDFRLDPDASGLAASPPVLRVKVAAAAGAAVVVNGASVAIGPDGRGVADVSVLSELTGPSPSPATLDKSIPYLVTPKRAAPASGELLVRTPIATLVVESPGASVVLEGPHFWLAGRTQPGGVVSVSGRPITVDESGGFAQLMSVSAEGETTIFIRADAPGHAPRLVPLRVRRVGNLRAEAARLDAQVTRSYSEILERLAAKRSVAVGLDATIVEARVTGHRTTLLAAIGEGCAAPPCLVAVVHGARSNPIRGEVWRVYGRVERTVAGPPASPAIPEIEADLLLPPPAP